MWRQFIPGRRGGKGRGGGRERREGKERREGEESKEREKRKSLSRELRGMPFCVTGTHMLCIFWLTLQHLKQWQRDIGMAYPQHLVAQGFLHSATAVPPLSGVPAWENNIIRSHINTSRNSASSLSHLPSLPSLPLPLSSHPHLVAQCIGVDRSSPPTAFTSAPFWMM